MKKMMLLSAAILLSSLVVNPTFSQFLAEAKADAQFLTNGFESVDDCYTLQFGSKELKAETEMAAAAEALAQPLTIVTNEGCSKVKSVNSYSVVLKFENGSETTIEMAQLKDIQSTPGYSEKMMYNVTSMVVSDISVDLADGQTRQLADKTFMIKK